MIRAATCMCSVWWRTLPICGRSNVPMSSADAVSRPGGALSALDGVIAAEKLNVAHTLAARVANGIEEVTSSR